MTRLLTLGVLSLTVCSMALAQGGPARGRPGASTAPSATDTADVNGTVRAYGASLIGAPPDPSKTAAFYTKDGEMLPPGGVPVVGPDSIRSMLSEFGKFVVESETMTPRSTTVMGRHAVVWGDYTQRAIPPGQPPINVGGRFVMELERQVTGKWLVRRLLVQPS